MSALRPLLNEAIQIELRQIRCLTMLGCMAPDAFTRDIVLGMILKEAGEAKFWNTVDAAYCGVEITGGCPDICPGTWPGMPGTCPTPGMPGTCPMPGMPDFSPTPGMPGTCPMPGMPGTCPSPGMPGTCPMPGMPDFSPTPGMPGTCPMPGMPGTCPSPGMPGTSPGMSPGGTVTPGWNPAAGMGPGQGFFSEEAKKEAKDKQE